MRKGISLPVETTVVIALAIIVLVALLIFFNGTWSPGVDRIKWEQKRSDLCSKYVANDADCREPPSQDLTDACKALGTPKAMLCCSAYCPKIDTEKQCAAAGGVCVKDVGEACDNARAKDAKYTGRIGSCIDNKDDPIQSICCAK